jgi:hypothetical protein
MVEWGDARKIVAETFFMDEIELFRNEITLDDLGEEHENAVLVGTYSCNLQYEPTAVRDDVSGKDIAQLLRISLPKDVPHDYSYTYRAKIKKARMQFDDRYWSVLSWKESQISSVLIASREVKV